MSTKTEIFRFGTPRQETGSKHVPPGTLIDATNCRMVKAGVYERRLAFDYTYQDFVGGSLSGSAADIVGGKGTNTLMRDTGGQLWERSSSANSFRYMGTACRTWMERNMVLSRRYTDPRPFSCMVGNFLWAFAITSSSYDLTILDVVGDVVVQDRISIAAANIVHASAVYDGVDVWVFWVDNAANGKVYAHRILVSEPTTAPALTTYYTMPSAPVNVSGVKLQQVAAKYMPSANQVFVCAAGGYLNGGTAKRACMHSVLDRGTGFAVTAGGQAASVSIAYSGASGGYWLGGLAIHDGQDGSSATWYYTVAGVDGTDLTTWKLLQVEVNSGGFSVFNARVVESGTPLPGTPWSFTNAALCSGSYQVIVSTRFDPAMASRFIVGTQVGYWTRMYHVSGATITWKTSTLDGSPENHLWLASGCAYAGGAWHVVMAYDDFGEAQTSFGSEALTTQRTYYAMRIIPGASATATTFSIEGQHAQGIAPALWHRNTAAVTYGGATMPINKVPQMHTGPTRTPLDGKIFAAVAFASPTVGTVDVGVLSLDPQRSYGHDVMIGASRGLTSGSVPMVWGNGDIAHELAPLIACPFFTLAGGGAATFNVIAVVYSMTSPDGTVWRAAPKVLQTSINASATLTIPVIPIKTAMATLQAEVYLGTTSPMLQTVLNFADSTVSATLTWTLPASTAALLNGEVLYTWGGELSQSQPIEANAVGYWKNRVLLGARSNVYSSSEHSEGIGPYFSEQQFTFWGDASGDITGISPVDDNYCAVFCASGISALCGLGPDRRGSGNFLLKLVSTRAGLTVGYKCLQGPAGCYYPDNGTGRLRVVTPSLQDVDCGGGAWDYTGIGAHGAWSDRDKVVAFTCSDGFLVIDYQHPTEAAPYGQVYHWSLQDIPCATAVDSAGLLYMSSDVSIRRYGSAAGYDARAGGQLGGYMMKLASAEIQPAGMQGEFSLSNVQFLLSIMAAGGIKLTIYPAFASRTRSPAASNVSSKTVTFSAPDMPGDPEEVMHRPSYCGRIESFGFSLEQLAGATTAGVKFEGIAIEYVPHGKFIYPASGKVI